VTTLTIPGHRIVRRLGQGGTATVYLAIQESFGREVALKVMSPMLNADPTFTMRFVREARIVAQMHHASIVPVFDVGECHPYHYLSMEYLPGGDLRQRIVEGRSSAALAIDVCMAVSSALELAHRKGFVHRDIKPQNILFREDGAPVLTDFGIARAVDVGTSLTVAGMLVGTPAYMSPEQVKGLDLDGRTDIYSLGMVFYEMLTGAVPFRTDSDSTLSIAMKHLSEILPPLPPEHSHLQALLDRLTAKEREHRFSNATEVVRALRALNEGQSSRAHTFIGTRPRRVDATTEAMPQKPGVSLHDPTPLPAPPPGRSLAPWFGGAAIAAAIALAIAGTLTLLNTSASAPAGARVETLQSVVPAPQKPANASTDAAVLPRAVTPAASPPGNAAVEQSSRDAASAQLAAVPPITMTPQQRAEDERRKGELAAQAERTRRIDSLLATARDDYVRGALVSPASENAADRYRQVLKLDPSNAKARDGLEQVANRIVERADQALRNDDIAISFALMQEARAVQPDHPELMRLEAALKARQLALVPQMQKAREHMARAERYLSRTPMIVDAAADADDHYSAALKLAPKLPGLPALRERVIAAYVAAAEFEISRNQPKRAINTVNYAKRRGVTTPRLVEIEQMAAQRMSAR
jgi:serine/threonine protein kinase